MNALIIDDHKINSLYLKTFLESNFPILKKIDEAGTLAMANQLLEVVNYDLIFLDIELTDGMGFDILKQVKDFVYVIVVTKHKEYAIQAFKHNVIDYILKPINHSEVKNAVKKVIGLYEKDLSKNSSADVEPAKAKDEADDSFMIYHKNQYMAIAKKDILFIKALGKYSVIHLASKSPYTSYKNLKEFENTMRDSFIRTHHSYLVNLKYIVSYCRETSLVKLSNGTYIPVSVRKREELFKKFRLL